MIWPLVKIYTLHIHSRTESSKHTPHLQSITIVYFISVQMCFTGKVCTCINTMQLLHTCRPGHLPGEQLVC